MRNTHAQYAHTCEKSIKKNGKKILGVIVIGTWSLFNAGLLFFILHKLNILRVSLEVERDGLDKHEHGGSAVNMNTGYTIRGKQPSF